MVDNAVMQLIDVVVEALVATVVVGASVAVEASVVDACVVEPQAQPCAANPLIGDVVNCL